MRRQDKYRNMEQANLMLENSYLKSKGLLKEEAEEKVKITVGTSHGDITYIGQLGREGDGLYYFKPEEGGYKFIPKDSSMVYFPDWVYSGEKTFNSLIGKKIKIDYESGLSIQLGGEKNPGSMYIGELLHGEQGVKIEKI